MTERPEQLVVTQSTRMPVAGMCYPLPLNESARLKALNSLEVLDTPPDDRFDRIVRLASAHFKMPVSRITFVDHDRSWFKARIGLNAKQAPRAISICSYAIMNDDVMVVPDLARDHRFESSPQVIGAPHFRFYAGAPIVLSGGFRVGSVCLMDYQPRPDFTTDDQAFLADLAHIVVHELDLHKQIADRDTLLVSADQEIDIAKKAKERFLSIVSHEFKTPLNAILGFGRMIADQALGPIENQKYSQYAQHLCQSAVQLNTLIDRVLTFSSAEAAELQLLEQTVEIVPLVNRCIQSTAASRGFSEDNIIFTIEKDAPTFVFLDDVQFIEILTELLLNAISFTGKGRVAITLGVHHDGGFRLTVEDQGKGIEIDKLEHVMAAFSLGDESLTRSHDGIGLGLPIAKALTELHGGQLRVEVPTTGGTRVEVDLPAYRNRSLADLQSENSESKLADGLLGAPDTQG